MKTTMKTQIDKKRFGPWALITGRRRYRQRIRASDSRFGHQCCARARREALLEELGRA